jgi:hypothetical protein
MSKFLENIKGKIKKLPSLFVKRLININLLGDLIEITFPSILISHTIKGFLEDLTIKLNNDIVYDINIFPSDFEVKLNNNLYPNQNLSEIYYRSLKIGDKLEIIIPNRFNISAGTYNIVMETPSSGRRVSFERYISSSTEKPEEIKPLLVQKEVYRRCSYCKKEILDPNQIICEYCGSEVEN